MDALTSGLSTFYIRVYENSCSKSNFLGRYPDVSLKEASEKASKIVMHYKKKKISDIRVAAIFAKYSQK